MRPSKTDLLGVFLAGMVVLFGRYRLFGDSDPATHTATGYWILRNGEIPRVDPFSATHAGGEWFAYEWFTDILFAIAHRIAGWNGLLVLSVLLIAAAHVLLYRFLVRRGDNSLVSFGAVVTAAATASSHWLARPHLFTVLFLVLSVIVLEEVVSGRRRKGWLWTIPPLAALWANMHGGYLVVHGVLLCYLIGTIILARPWDRADSAASPSARHSRALLRPLAVTLAASVAAIFLNPWGWRLPVHLIGFSTIPPELDDFAGPSLDRAGLALAVFLAICLIGVACGYWGMLVRHRMRSVAVDGSTEKVGGAADGDSLTFHPGTLLSLGMATLMAFMSIRHVEIMVVFGAIVIAGGASHLLKVKQDDGARAEWESMRRYEATHGGLILALVLLVIALFGIAGRAPRAGYDPALFPVEMVRSLKEAGAQPGGVVFAPDVWGGYLILEWPAVKVFVDGRWDMYGKDFMERYQATYYARPNWSARLEEAGVTWALLPLHDPLVRPMREHPDWQPWRADETAIAFRSARLGDS